MTTSTGRGTDEADITRAVTAERRGLCDLLDTCASTDWQTPSLCPGWNVVDVVADLTLTTRDTVWDVVKGVVRARGSWDRMTADTAREHARRFTTDELVQQLRDTADSTRRAPMSSPLDPLLDVLVHGQDIARPLGRDHVMASDHAVPALDHAVTSRWYGASKRLRDLRLVATDADWTSGTGELEVSGASGDLLLVATGRRAGLDALSGSGLDVLAGRLD